MIIEYSCVLKWLHNVGDFILIFYYFYFRVMFCSIYISEGLYYISYFNVYAILLIFLLCNVFCS